VDAGGEESEIVNLTVDAIVLDAIGTYARKFRSDDVGEAEQRALLAAAVADAEAVDATTEKTQALRDEILGGKLRIAEEALAGAYREDGRGLAY